ncbi:unnamed protein product [Allacma fusca]|uniref:2-phosphoxylose phosphatase 1 n=2 Tax=Allacma fusca TaxID=39272 RepID=A0A8J2P6K6_9HEXA|nr:unnamed protein product [Allacma fusca]
MFTVILLVPIILAANEAGTTTPKSVHIIYRHGERTADSSFQTMTGGLTEKGKKQMYELGLYFRERYSNLLKTSFDAHETQIISSDTDRTIRSAGLVAYGLYEDFNSAAKWNGEDHPVRFEPIPVRSIPPELDRYLQPKVPCPRLAKLSGTAWTQYFDGLLERHARLLNIYVKEMNDEDFINRDIDIEIRTIKFISFMEEAEFNSTHGLPLRDWTVEMMQLDDFRYFKTHTNTPDYIVFAISAVITPPFLRKGPSNSL